MYSLDVAFKNVRFGQRQDARSNTSFQILLSFFFQFDFIKTLLEVPEIIRLIQEVKYYYYYYLFHMPIND